MEPAIQVINVLLSVLNSDNVEFVGLKGTGVRNIASIIQQAEQFVADATAEPEAEVEEIVTDE